mmetsp:Transcript_32960/g.97140  ORF Transcript_32960/g.97140 Transcript_32960/m.97140 type:complete len:637 (-) Transcript_32960:155-2065(-)
MLLGVWSEALITRGPRPCLDNCTQRGDCVEGKCVCNEGYAGEDCSMSVCSSGCPGQGLRATEHRVPPLLHASGPPPGFENAAARVAVAVCGQLGRLELRSKVQNLALPNMRTNIAMVMFLALQDKGPNATRLRSDTTSSKLPPIACKAQLIKHAVKRRPCRKDQYSCTDGRITVVDGCHGIFTCDELPHQVECGANPDRINGFEVCRCKGKDADASDAGYPNRSCTAHAYSPAAAVAELKRAAIAHVALFIRESPWKHIPEAVSDWMASFKHLTHKGYHSQLVEINANFRSAALMIEQYEIRYRFHFDQILLLRDDSVVVLPYLHPFLGVRSMGTALATGFGPCVVKRCYGWLGIQDKAMMCPRPHLQAMLRGFLDDMHLDRESGLWQDWWDEKLRERTLARYGVPIMRVDPDEMPLVVARPPCFCQASVSSPGAPWCLRSATSDCPPPQHLLDPAAGAGDLYVSHFYTPSDDPVYAFLAKRTNQSVDVQELEARTTFASSWGRKAGTADERAKRSRNFGKVATFEEHERIDPHCGDPPRVHLVREPLQVAGRCLLGLTFGCDAADPRKIWVMGGCRGAFSFEKPAFLSSMTRNMTHARERELNLSFVCGAPARHPITHKFSCKSAPSRYGGRRLW